MTYQLDRAPTAIKSVYDAVCAKHHNAHHGMELDEDGREICLSCGGKVFYYHDRLTLVTRGRNIIDIHEADYADFIWRRVEPFVG